MSIYPILLMYSVAITNTTQSFITNQLGYLPPPRSVLSLILILGFMAIIRLGQPFIIKSMSFLVYPFIASLMILSVYLIPHWNGAIFHQTAGLQSHGTLMTVFLIIPVMVFSFNHSPIISSFAVDQKRRFSTQADQKSASILRQSHAMMVFTVMFFVFSCVFSLSPQDLALAKQQNISILSYLANHFHTPFIAYVAPLLAFIAISKSFFGHYLGASEGLHGLLGRNKTIHRDKSCFYVEAFMIITCWITATLNPNILKMIETLGGPIIAVLLFLMPMYAILKVPAMREYRDAWKSNVFIVIIGVLALSAIVYGILGNI